MKVTLVISYYEAPQMLRQQIRHWLEYSSNVKVILVDDHSMIHPAAPIVREEAGDMLDQIELYRISQDIFQNTYGARNLGFHVAEDNQWIWNLDIDHVVPWESIKLFLDMDVRAKGFYYMPAREIVLDNVKTEVIQRHSDTFILTKETYWKTGGYDEDLVGFYFNGPAKRFRKILRTVATPVTVNHGVKTLFYNQRMVSDASPVSQMEKRRFEGHIDMKKKPNILKFDWERIL